MAESSGSSSIALPTLPKILSTSENTRKGAISALDEQYQRLAPSRTLRTIFSTIFKRKSAIFNQKSSREMAALDSQLSRNLNMLASTARQPTVHPKAIQERGESSNERISHQTAAQPRDNHGCRDIWPLEKLLGCTQCEDCGRDCKHYRFRCGGCFKGLCKH